MKHGGVSLWVLFLTVACGQAGNAPPSAPLHNDAGVQYHRIVSLDYCADQYVLKLADRENILAVSPDAVKEFSYMKDAAKGLPTVRPVAEDVLILKPDLVVRSYGGGPNAAAFFERVGVPVLNVGWANTIDGDGAGAIPHVIEQMAAGLGVTQRGAAVIDDYRRRLNQLQRRAENETALYVTPSGYTTGAGSLVHEMILTAGLENFQDQPGWRPLPLEKLAYLEPDVVASAVFDSRSAQQDQWAATRHPVVRTLFNKKKVAHLNGAATACGAWFAMDAVEALAGAEAKAAP